MGFYFQGAEEPKLKWEHITTLISSLREFVRSTDRKIIATTLSKLKLELDFDSHGISQVQVVLFGFQDAVSAWAAISPQTPLSVDYRNGIRFKFCSLHLLSKLRSLQMTDVRCLLSSLKDKRPTQLDHHGNSKTYIHTQGWVSP